MTVERMRTLLGVLRAELHAADPLPPDDELQSLLDDLEQRLEKLETRQ